MDNKCMIEGCEHKPKAKGYCKTHYTRLWRRGMLYSGTKTIPEISKAEVIAPNELVILERELFKAKTMYDSVVGFKGRIKWREEINAVATEIDELRKKTASRNQT